MKELDRPPGTETMPRPPILEPIDFKAVFAGGKTYKQWLAAAESKDNARKMEDLRKGLVIEPPQDAYLASLPRTVHVIAIAEDWCGDVHRHVPVLELLASKSPKLKTRYIAREDHPEVFKRFLTNGGEAIPKFIFFNDKFVEVGNWGPMQDDCRRLIARGKAAGDVAAARKRVSAVYESDPHCHEPIRELLQLISIAICSKP